MPYIDLLQRFEIDCEVRGCLAKDVGELNFIISKIIHNYLHDEGRRKFNYETLNSVIGVLECAKQELYRTVVTPYEDKKRLENGSVSDLDLPKQSIEGFGRKTEEILNEAGI